MTGVQTCALPIFKKHEKEILEHLNYERCNVRLTDVNADEKDKAAPAPLPSTTKVIPSVTKSNTVIQQQATPVHTAHGSSAFGKGEASAED